MVSFKETLIEDLIDEIAMGPFGSNIKKECFVDEGIPVLNGSNLVGYALNEDSFGFVTEEKADSLGRANASRKDVVITHRGTLGQASFIPDDSQYERYVISQSQFRVRCNEKILPEYLVYFLHSPIGQYRLLSNTNQVGVPALGRPTSTFKKISVMLPDMTIQKNIVSILETIRRKIETNNQINGNLSEQAKAIFKKELLKFEDVPEGWTKASLDSIANYLNGLAMQKFRPKDTEKGIPVLKIKELRQGVCDEASELCSPGIKQEYIVNDGDVIFSWSGSLLVDFWCGGKCGLNQHLFKVTSKDYDKWFYYAWTLYHLDNFIFLAADKATTMGHIKREELTKAQVLIPSKEDYDRIGELLSPIYETIILKRIENKRLSTLRDSLLPKLMSGELDVEEVDL